MSLTLKFIQFGLNKPTFFSILVLSSFGSLITAGISQYFSNSNGWPILPEIFHTPIFQIRGDQLAYAMVPALFWCGHQIKVRQTFKFPFILIIIIIFLLFPLRMHSRAVFFSSLITFFFLASFIFSKITFKSLIFSVLFFVSLLEFLRIIDIQFTVISKLIAGLKLVPIDNNIDPNVLTGFNTQNARISAWKSIFSYFQNYMIFGVNPGRNYVYDSGAYVYLSGSEDVRAPHNMWISFFLRNGVFLGLLLCFVIAILVFCGLKLVRSSHASVCDWTVVSMLISIFVVSSFGVVFESPFGYIPATVLGAYVFARNIQIRSI